MTATASQIQQLRRMTAEPTTATYADTAMRGYIEAHPLMDERGELPYTFSSDTPPVHVDNTNWIATYDLHAAAAEIWEEKAALWIDQHSFSASGSSFARSDVYQHMMERVRYHRARRATSTMTAYKHPDEPEGASSTPWIANLPEDD